MRAGATAPTRRREADALASGEVFKEGLIREMRGCLEEISGWVVVKLGAECAGASRGCRGLFSGYDIE
ncbi:unnamed protein product, partial [Iphiclides podalirius]